MRYLRHFDESNENYQISGSFFQSEKLNNFHIIDLFSEKSESSLNLGLEIENTFNTEQFSEKSETSVNLAVQKNKFLSLNCSVKKMKAQ